MKCPHCLQHFSAESNRYGLGKDREFQWVAEVFSCPACRGLIVFLRWHFAIGSEAGRRLVHPKGSARAPVPAEVPTQFAEDYKEACLVLADSAKASAALSRRCLQHILREVGAVTPGNLYDEIEEIINSGKVPTHIGEALHAVRTIGNFAAHPVKSRATGEIVGVEPGEAEWNLDVLECLFDFYFVQPALLKKKKEALNAKLGEAGKPQVK